MIDMYRHKKSLKIISNGHSSSLTIPRNIIKMIDVNNYCVRLEDNGDIVYTPLTRRNK